MVNMSVLQNKIDFALVFTVHNANPNGDPLDGNRPRTTYTGHGEVSDVCLKRKIRNRWIDEGYPVFVQSDDRRAPGDSYRSLKERAEGCPALKELQNAIAAGKEAKTGAPAAIQDDYMRIACQTWLDVRAFGQVFAFKTKKSPKKGDKDGENKDEEGGKDMYPSIRGPVSIQSAFSLEPVNVVSMQITKSVNLEPGGKGADTMGLKHRVEYGVYVTYGSINVQPAEKTGFSVEDALALREALRTLFRNDSSSARPDGSMEVAKLIWWEHNCKSGQYPAAKVHRSLRVGAQEFAPGVRPEVRVDETEIPGLQYTIIDGE